MEQQNLHDNAAIEIDVFELLHVLLRKFWIVLLTGIIFAGAFIAGTIFLITPQYKSTTKMYVLNQQDNSTLTQQDMQTSLSLTKDYAELIKSRTVTEGVISQLDLELTHEELLNKITIDSATDTRILSITVEDPDPREACKIADAMRDVAAKHIKNVMNINAVNVVEPANVPEQKSSPSISKNAVIGGFLGVLLAIAIILISHLSNDTIKTQEDVEKYLELSILGTIPLTDTKHKQKKKKKARGRR